MLHWLKSLFVSEHRHKQIFEYRDPQGIYRRADPLEVWRSLETQGGPYWLDTVLPLTQAVIAAMPEEALLALHKDRQEAIRLLAVWVRTAFGFKAFADGGPVDAWCLDLLADLLKFVNQIEAEYRPFSFSRKRDAPSPSTPSEPTTV